MRLTIALKQYWLNVNWTPSNTLQLNSSQNIDILCHKNAFENVFAK